MINNDSEYVLCACIHWDDGKEYSHQPININSGLCIAGYRHFNIMIIGSQLFGNAGERSKKGIKEIQGFLTSKNRFLNREESAKLVIEVGQKDRLKYFNGNKLDSSDLY